MEFITRDKNDNYIIKLSPREMTSKFPEWVYSNIPDELVDEPVVVDLEKSQLKTNSPHLICEEGFVCDPQILQGVLQMDTANPDYVTLYGYDNSREEFQNAAIRYLFDLMLAHGLLKLPTV